MAALLTNDISAFNARIKARLFTLIREDKQAMEMLEKIKTGKASYDIAYQYAERVAKHVSTVLDDMIPDDVEWTPQNVEITRQAMMQALEQGHRLSAGAAQSVDQLINDKLGISIKSQAATFSEDLASGLVKQFTAAPVAETRAKTKRLVETYHYKSVDRTLRKNAAIMELSGLKTWIVRYDSKDKDECDWCKGLAGLGKVPYSSNMDTTIFRRHSGCRCVLDRVSENPKKHVIVWDGAELNTRRPQ